MLIILGKEVDKAGEVDKASEVGEASEVGKASEWVSRWVAEWPKWSAISNFSILLAC